MVTPPIGEKNGTKRSVLSEEKGVPLSITLSGANTHDIKLLEKTLDKIIVPRPETVPKTKENLCLDAAYISEKHEKNLKIRGYIPHIRPRGEEKQEIEKNPNFKPRRWVIEVCHSWLNRFRKLLVRFEKKAENYLNLLYFACSIIAWRQTIKVHS